MLPMHLSSPAVSVITYWIKNSKLLVCIPLLPVWLVHFCYFTFRSGQSFGLTHMNRNFNFGMAHTIKSGSSMRNTCQTIKQSTSRACPNMLKIFPILCYSSIPNIYKSLLFLRKCPWFPINCRLCIIIYSYNGKIIQWKKVIHCKITSSSMHFWRPSYLKNVWVTLACLIWEIDHNEA